MGTQVDRLPVQGLAIPSRLISPETLRPLDADTPASVFQQAEPAAGAAAPVDADSRLQLDLTGGQDAEIEVMVVRAGLPGVNGLGVVYRFTSEAADDTVGDGEAWRWRGEPAQLNDAAGLVRNAGSDDFEYFDLVTSAVSHDLLALYVDAGNDVVCCRWDSGAAEWGAPVDVSVTVIGSTSGVGANQNVAGVALPDGSVLAFAVNAEGLAAYRSQDYGATWEPWSQNAADPGSSSTMRAAYHRGDIALLLETGAGDLSQYVSTDMGATFSAVEAEQAGVLESGTRIRTAFDLVSVGSSLVVAYLRSDGYPCVRLLAAAGEPWSTATEIIIESAARASITIEADETGALYVAAADHTNADIHVYVSLNGGLTWTSTGPGVNYPAGSSDPILPGNLGCAWYRGRFVLGYQWIEDVGGGGEDFQGSVMTAWSAGWSNLHPGTGSPPSRVTPEVWSQPLASVALPDGLGLTAVGATAATIATPGVLQWVVAASDGAYSKAGTAGEGQQFLGVFRVTAGTPSVASLTHGILIRVANGTSERFLEVRIGASSIVLVDRVGATTLATITVDTSDWIALYAAVNQTGTAFVAYRAAGSSRWTPALGLDSASVVLTENTSGPASTPQTSFGWINAGTGTVQWRCYQFNATSGLLRMGLQPLAGGIQFSAQRQPSGLLSARGAALPDVGSTTRAALLSARRGPGRRGERVTISPVYTYGVDNFFPRLAESPDRVWRSTDKTACSFVFDLGEYDGKLGPDWIRVLGLFRTNFRKAFLESSADGSSWTLRDTWDAATGFVDLDYELQGQTIRPTSGTASGARPLHRNELAGGYAIFDNTTALEIRGNSAGVWASPTGTTKWAEVEVIGDVSGLGATGEVVLVFPNAVSFGRFSGVQPTLVDRFWRVRITSGEITPWSYLQIGKLFLGDAVVFGKRSSRGWQREVRPNARRSISRYGTIRKRQDGPPAGRWTLGWADGEQQARHRAGLTDVDYVRAGSSGPALAMRDDVYANVVALLEETRSGEVPVLALASIPDEATTINDRSLFLYGSLEGGASFGQVEGREGYDAFGRVDPITIDEIR